MGVGGGGRGRRTTQYIIALITCMPDKKFLVSVITYMCLCSVVFPSLYQWALPLLVVSCGSHE